MRSLPTDPEQHSTSASPAEPQAAAPRPESAPGGNSLYNEFGLPLPKWHPAAAHNVTEPTAPEPDAPAASPIAPAPIASPPGEPGAATAAGEEPNRSGS